VILKCQIPLFTRFANYLGFGLSKESRNLDISEILKKVIPRFLLIGPDQSQLGISNWDQARSGSVPIGICPIGCGRINRPNQKIKSACNHPWNLQRPSRNRASNAQTSYTRTAHTEPPMPEPPTLEPLTPKPPTPEPPRAANARTSNSRVANAHPDRARSDPACDPSRRSLA
jgi:hypothetical protein